MSARLTIGEVLLAIFFAMCWLLCFGGGADAQQRRVLLLYPYNSLFPTSMATGDATIRRLSARAGSSLELYTDFLDLGRFSGEAYEKQTALALADKYRGRKPEVVIAVGPQSLNFLMRNRESLTFDVPIVFCCTSRTRLAALSPPRTVTGIISEFEIKDTLALARQLQPNAREIAILAGASVFDRTSAGIARSQLAPFEKDYKLTEIVGLRHEETIERLKALPRDTIVILLTMFNDAAGRLYVTPELIPELSAAAAAPIYTPYEAYLGRGVIGGNSDSLERVGTEIADLALDILSGASPDTLPPRVTSGNANRIDWRQLKRFGFSEAALPPGTEVRHRQYTPWELYRWQIIGMIALVLLQAAIITALMLERRRRRTAEAGLRQRLMEVVHLNRSAVAGALSASVAHELNQPLGAIEAYAEAASLYLKAQPPNLERVGAILASIRQEDRRAADIIAHLRGLLKKKDESELEQFDLNGVVHDALEIIRPEALKRGFAVEAQQAAIPLEVRGDRIQLQQVILNLAMNGLDAMQGASGDGKMSIETAVNGGSTVEVTVADSGTGIAAGKLGEIFDAFYTTKRHGTGLGLPIARTIVETYGGRIWAENLAAGGAAFRFTLPLRKMAGA